MRRIVMVLSFLTFVIAAAAQKNLSSGIRNSAYTYVYRITAEEAGRLAAPKSKEADDQYFHTLVDSFPISSITPSNLPEGNYLFASARGNRLAYRFRTYGDLTAELIDNGRDAYVLLHNRAGRSITDASVHYAGERLPYDPKMNAYGPTRHHSESRLWADYHDVRYSFDVENHERSRASFWKRLIDFPKRYLIDPIARLFRKKEAEDASDALSGTGDYQKDFRSFMVFGKPKYKPGDTVRLKAFVETSRGRLVNRPLALHLIDNETYKDTVLAIVQPYRPGGYDHQFVLSEALALELDRTYILTLEETSTVMPSRKKANADDEEEPVTRPYRILAKKEFEYEEYELDKATFNARALYQTHSRGREEAVFVSATDDNGLAVMDGRVQLIVTRQEPFVTTFHAPQVFIPDTLWVHEQSLDNVGETKIVLPDSIFPRASFDYEVECRFLNSENELQTESMYLKFLDEAYAIRFENRGDSLFIDQLHLGMPEPADARLYSFNDDYDTIGVRSLTLPAAIRIDPFARSYDIETDSTDDSYEVSSNNVVYTSTRRTRDSIFVQLQNPYHLPVWYALLEERKPVLQGFGDTLTYAARANPKKKYWLVVHYIYGGSIRRDEESSRFLEKRLRIDIDQPAVVYPGQSVPIAVHVRDMDGHPVPGADVTAYSYTSKFGTDAVRLPYFDRRYKDWRPSRLSLDEYVADPKTRQLSWQRWSRELGLDTIEYYRFLHPDGGVYRNSELAPDSLTQITPFVVNNGDIQAVQLLYIDERPVFFSQAQQLSRYSFSVSPGPHRLRLRTTNAEVRVDSIYVPAGAKTFFSFDAVRPAAGVHVEKRPAYLTAYEQGLWTKYLIVLDNDFDERFAYVQQGNVYYLANPNPADAPRRVLLGPLADNYGELTVKRGFRQVFRTQGASEYTIADDFVRQRQFNDRERHFDTLLNKETMPLFTDYVLTEREIDSLWQDYLDRRGLSTDLFYRKSDDEDLTGRLSIDLSDAAPRRDLFIRQAVFFRYDDPDFIDIRGGEDRRYEGLAPGAYRVLFLMRKDQYFTIDSITVLPNTLSLYRAGKIEVHPADSLSTLLSRIVEARPLNVRRETDRSLSALREKLERGADSLREVTGTVVDERGKPVPAVLVRGGDGRRQMTMTAADGSFRLMAPTQGKLNLSAIDYMPAEVELESDSVYRIVLHHEVTTFLADSLVMPALGSRGWLGETVVTTKFAEPLIMGGVYGFSSLSGRAAGVSVTDRNEKPLLIVDGVPFDGDLDMSRVASMQVLKADAATALYGARAAAGVIIVTTTRRAADADPFAAPTVRRHFRDEAFWQPRLLTDNEGVARFTATFPDDITGWNTTAIASTGHRQNGYAIATTHAYKVISANIAAPSFLIAGDSVNVIAKTLNYLSDSITVQRRFSVNGRLLRDGTVGVRTAWIDTFAVTAHGEDSLKLQYLVARDNSLTDGEERAIPVLRAGVPEATGHFVALDRDTALTLAFRPDTARIRVYAEASLLPVIYEEAERVRNYEYLCNEQLASKLMAVVAQKKIDGYLKRPFKNERNINELIGKLEKSRSASGLWGWWANGEPSAWISLHVIEALLQARTEGYEVEIDEQLVTDYLVFRLGSLEPTDRITALFLLHELDAEVDYAGYIVTMEKSSMPLYAQLRLAELKQLTGQSVNLDRLLPLQQHTALGNLYWGEDNRQFFNNSIQNTLAMYRILTRAGGHDAERRKIRNYLLEARRGGQWRNTYESALIMQAILPDLLTEQSAGTPTLTIGARDTIRVMKFPYTADLPAATRLSIGKAGNATIYFTAYQQGWNSDPARVEGTFSVRTSFLRDDRPITELKAGQPVELKVVVHVNADAEYVMVEVPIPAGCSYTDKQQGTGNGEVHREHFRNKVSIFCQSLGKGDHEFRLSLTPRYTGSYTLNPARAELMYFPVLYGREGLRRVAIR